MSFSTLRTNDTVFILHKDATPSLDIAQVDKVTTPIPNFNTFNQNNVYTVDITVRIGEQFITYSKLPGTADIADWGTNGNLVIATSRDTINNEINNLLKQSSDIINSLPFHQSRIKELQKISEQLNPEIAEKAKQQNDINSLKTQVASLSDSIKQLMEINKNIMDKINK